MLFPSMRASHRKIMDIKSGLSSTCWWDDDEDDVELVAWTSPATSSGRSCDGSGTELDEGGDEHASAICV